jgi:hypothetical protein
MSKLIVAVLTLLLVPAIAYATETYTVTESASFCGPACATQFSFTEPTILAIGDTTSITPISGAVVTDFSWSSAGGCTLGGFPTKASACITYQGGGGLIDAFALGSFLTDGTYTSLGGDETVTISGNIDATPEPSTVVLFVTGLVILVLRRNR